MNKNITLEYLKDNFKEVRINFSYCDYISVPISCFKKFEANIEEINNEYHTSYIKMEIENNNNMWYHLINGRDISVSPIDKLNKSGNIVSLHLINGCDKTEIIIDWLFNEDYSKNLAQLTRLIDYKTIEILFDINSYYIKRKNEIEKQIDELNYELEFYNTTLIENGVISNNHVNLPK